MEHIKIEATDKTPNVNFDADNGKLELSGRSIPENVFSFYKPLFDWLDNYISVPNKITEVNFKIEYFNTSSSKAVLSLLEKIKQIHLAGNEVIINWYYEDDDDDMFDTGKDFETIVNIPVNMIEFHLPD